MSGAWRTTRVRDLSVMMMPDGSHLLVACDSLGGIGPKRGDQVAATAYTTAHFATRVPLLEIVAARAAPRLIVNNLCFEGGRDADEMRRAVVDLAVEVGLDEAAVTGSTEENVPTTTTGVGITVIGSVDPGDLRLGSSRPGDLVVCLGRPRSAPRFRITTTDIEMPSVAEVVAVLAIPGVHEVLPVGSRGVANEIDELAGTAGLRHQFIERHRLQDSGLDLHASGGPASCVLVSLLPEALPDVRSVRAGLPVTVVGQLLSPHLPATHVPSTQLPSTQIPSTQPPSTQR